MRETLKGRLGRLERTTMLRQDDLAQIQSVALRAVSDEDLEHLESIAARGAPFTSCSAAEKAALERSEAEINAAKGSLQRRSSGARGCPDRVR